MRILIVSNRLPVVVERQGRVDRHGRLIPLVLKRLRMDLALASGPILSTILDLSGFFLVLSIASAVRPHLAS